MSLGYTYRAYDVNNICDIYVTKGNIHCFTKILRATSIHTYMMSLTTLNVTKIRLTESCIITHDVTNMYAITNILHVTSIHEITKIYDD